MFYGRLIGISCFAVVVCVAGTACDKPPKLRAKPSWHANVGWKAEDYFTDPKVIALCKAIEADDLREIDRLVAGGADVNAVGKDNMTPLMWAFPDNKLDRFKCLLKHGANPNVAVTTDLNTQGVLERGTSVTHMAAGTEFSGYFEAVFTNGGDPNLVRTVTIWKKVTPLFTLIAERAQKQAGKAQDVDQKGRESELRVGQRHHSGDACR